MTTAIICICVFFGLIFIFSVILKQKEEETENKIIEKLNEKNIQLSLEYKGFTGTIGLDDINKKLVITRIELGRLEKLTIVDYNNIFSCELMEDGNTIYKKSMTRVVGGAIVGAAIAGGAGAIVGGLSGNSKKTIDKITLKISVKDIATPVISYTFYDKSWENIKFLQERKDIAYEWSKRIELIIDENEKNINS